MSGGGISVIFSRRRRRSKEFYPHLYNYVRERRLPRTLTQVVTALTYCNDFNIREIQSCSEPIVSKRRTAGISVISVGFQSNQVEWWNLLFLSVLRKPLNLFKF